MGDRDELLIKYLLSETSTEENSEIQRWMAEDSANQTYYNHFKQIWETSKKLEPLSTIDEEQAWRKFKARVSQPIEKEVKVVPLRYKYGWLKIAAIFLVAAGIWSTYRHFIATDYIAVGAGKEVVVKTLPDGSVLTLNKNSLMSFANNFTDHRAIRLQKGEVFFKVTPNKEKPFIIDADKVTIRVVGTSFNVKHVNEETEVIVETGIVKVSVGSTFVELRRGEKVLIKNGSTTLKKETNTDQLYNYYRSKAFILNNTQLSKFITTLNEAYQVNIVIEDPRIKNLTLTTTFTEDSLNHILQTICQTLDIKQVHSEGKILLVNKL
ncbi:ferric-dicitrate binding protein FerR (iron transport regulator) [Pedobacter cryoconitis]|uniref:FecR family protein n=1 Tax=Pedobacter cryoconitis TaxID=188932 RepID=UPI00160CAE27|nr:FecR domain-containing protein [Pedobacter cryoconitis]MBB6271986.1 ferric-dicitrate binding protein FerR (iron transport regulator) [Pedobacter cryoconitis]